jgi:FkbM family methyltransferase
MNKLESIYIHLPPILKKVIRMFKLEEEKYFNSTSIDDFFCKDFKDYFEIKSPCFNLNLIEPSDWAEVVRMVKNKLILAKNKKIKLNKKNTQAMKDSKNFFDKIRFKNGTYNLNYLGKQWSLPRNAFDISVFKYKYGLDSLPLERLQKIKGMDILDGGAFIGDSSIFLERYSPRKIYSFEPVKNNFEDLKKTIKMNRLDKKIIPIPKGVGEKREKLRISPEDSASRISKHGSETVEILDIDSFVSEKNLDVGLIKLDVEGFEINALNGARETIKKMRPILLISAYHLGKDFFEIPLLLKKLNKDYKIRFLNLNPAHPFAERIFIAY